MMIAPADQLGPKPAIYDLIHEGEIDNDPDHQVLWSKDYAAVFGEVHRLSPVSATDMQIQFTDDGGATWASGATDYKRQNYVLEGVGANYQAGTAQTTARLTPGGAVADATADPGLAMRFIIADPFKAVHTELIGRQCYLGGGGNPCDGRIYLNRWTAGRVDGFRFIAESGNLDKGFVRAYGLILPGML